MYPGLCDRDIWPNCTTGTEISLAIPLDYADPLLRNWTKP